MYHDNTKKVSDNINSREENCSTFLSDLGMGGDYEKLTLPVIVQVFIAFKKSNYFLNYTHFTNIRVNFIKIIKVKDKFALQLMVRKNKIYQVL